MVLALQPISQIGYKGGWARCVLLLGMLSLAVVTTTSAGDSRTPYNQGWWQQFCDINGITQVAEHESNGTFGDQGGCGQYSENSKLGVVRLMAASHRASSMK